MSESSKDDEERLGPEIPSDCRPQPENCSFDLRAALLAVYSIVCHIPQDAYTAPLLGMERSGNAVLIDKSGLFLTVGYLVTEAETIWLLDNAGRAVPGHVAAYDQETGFGLVQALGRIETAPLDIGISSNLKIGDPVIVAGGGGISHAIQAEVVAVREFAGYWEYLLDSAVFTAPPHPLWGGTALLGNDGTLRGIGSLFVQQTQDGQEPVDVNMMVPIDILKPIMEELLRNGKTAKPPRPWLGMFTTEIDDRVMVAGIADDGPAARAGVHVGDAVLSIGGAPVSCMADMFRTIWSRGAAGIDIPLHLGRGGDTIEVAVRSISRSDLLRSPAVH